MAPGRVIVAVTALLAGFVPASSAVTLEELLQDMADGPMVRAAGADQQRLESERRHRDAERGWSVFGGIDGGYYRELDATEDRVDYTGYGAQLGLRYPLLGTLRARTEALAEAEVAVARQEQTQRLQRAEQRLALRQAYIDWWEAHQKRLLCNELGSLKQQELQQVRDRAQGQGMRQSERMLIEQRWSTRMRTCQGVANEAAVLRNRVARIAGQSLPTDAEPVAPALAEEPAPLPRWSALVREHPLVASQRSELEEASQLSRDRWYHNVESNFTLSQRVDRRDDLPGTGTGLVAGLNFEMPLKSAFGRGHGNRSSARHTAARERLDGTRDQLRDELEKALQRYRRALDEVHGQVGQVALVRRIESERASRERVDTEAGFMALRTARIDRADAAFDLIRAWRNAWSEQAELFVLSGEDGDVERLLGRTGTPWPGYWVSGDAEPVALSPERRASDQAWEQAAYVWSSYRLLDPETRSSELDELQQAGFSRIYLGLDAEQVREVERLRPEIRRLVAEARQRGIATDLLLGEPTWIEPDSRQDLVELIRRMRGLPFDRLHLDLEVEQLGWPVPEQRVRDWLDTVERASVVSPWPVTLVSHHRWFAPEPEGDICVPCELADGAVDQVSLMIYITNPDRLTDMATDIADAWPALRFRIAQSVEPELDGENSWHGESRSALGRLNAHWNDTMTPAGIEGIEWQDWASFPRAEDEE